MLNQVHTEGFVTKKIWPYDGDLFFRLAVYRDQDREPKRAADRGPDEQHRPDYVTVRVPAGLGLLPVESGQRVQIHGWLESREFNLTLAEFLSKVQGEKPSVDPLQARNLAIHRDTTWIVADRVVVLPKKGARRRTNRQN
jgi:hypothetical protein